MDYFIILIELLNHSVGYFLKQIILKCHKIISNQFDMFYKSTNAAFLIYT